MALGQPGAEQPVLLGGPGGNPSRGLCCLLCGHKRHLGCKHRAFQSHIPVGIYGSRACNTQWLPRESQTRNNVTYSVEKCTQSHLFSRVWVFRRAQGRSLAGWDVAELRRIAAQLLAPLLRLIPVSSARLSEPGGGRRNPPASAGQPTLVCRVGIPSGACDRWDNRARGGRESNLGHLLPMATSYRGQALPSLGRRAVGCCQMS